MKKRSKEYTNERHVFGCEQDGTKRTNIHTSNAPPDCNTKRYIGGNRGKDLEKHQQMIKQTEEERGKNTVYQDKGG